MKKQLVVVTISTWLMLILIHSTWAITFDVASNVSSTYSTALKSLRNESKDKRLEYFGIPMLPMAPNPPAAILVELESDATTIITLALNRSNLYVLAYADKVGVNDRAHFFDDTPPNLKKDLFPKAKGKLRLNITYKSNYPALETKAGGDRMKTGLGMQKLNNRLKRVFGVAINTTSEKTQAEFLLIAIQMVAEATRFTYIEKEVVDNFNVFEFRPNYKVISLQNEWGKISTGIRNANTTTKKISPPIEIQVDEKNKVKVTNVTTIKPAVGLLNYVP